MSFNGTTLYADDTINGGAPITWSLATNGSGATFNEVAQQQGWSVSGTNNTVQNLKEAANDFTNVFRDSFVATDTIALYSHFRTCL